MTVHIMDLRYRTRKPWLVRSRQRLPLDPQQVVVSPRIEQATCVLAMLSILRLAQLVERVESRRYRAVELDSDRARLDSLLPEAVCSRWAMRLREKRFRQFSLLDSPRTCLSESRKHGVFPVKLTFGSFHLLAFLY